MRQTDGQTDRQTDRQTDMHMYHVFFTVEVLELVLVQHKPPQLPVLAVVA